MEGGGLDVAHERDWHPSLVPDTDLSNRVSFEFVNVGGWLSFGDLAIESRAHRLVVAGDQHA